MAKELTREQEKAMFAKGNNTALAGKVIRSLDNPRLVKLSDESGISFEDLEEIEQDKVADDIEEIKEDDAARLIIFENGEEWLYFKTEDDAIRRAEHHVREDLESNPESFDKDWLSNYYSVSEMDQRMIAGDLADLDVDDRGWTDLVHMAKDLGVDYDEFEQEKDEDSLREAVHDASYEYHLKHLKEDAIGYLTDDLGLYTREQALEKFAFLDVNEATEDAVIQDGWSHFVGTYDDNYDELKSGAVITRLN